MGCKWIGQFGKDIPDSLMTFLINCQKQSHRAGRWWVEEGVGASCQGEESMIVGARHPVASRWLHLLPIKELGMEGIEAGEHLNIHGSIPRTDVSQGKSSLHQVKTVEGLQLLVRKMMKVDKEIHQELIIDPLDLRTQRMG